MIRGSFIENCICMKDFTRSRIKENFSCEKQVNWIDNLKKMIGHFKILLLFLFKMILKSLYQRAYKEKGNEDSWW